jgi:hypothetical protein
MNFQHNDGGRSTSKRPKQKQDCVVRAIAIAFKMPYDAIYDELAALGRKSGNGTKKELWKGWLEGRVNKRSFPAVAGCKRMNPVAFCNQFPTGTFIIQMAGHLSVVIDGTVHDDFRIDETKCIYASWQVDK